MKKQPQSQELFLDLYSKMAKKIEESTDTIFTGVNIEEFAEINYERFMESSYSKQFFLDDTIYQKNLTIKAFIENEVLSEFYTNTYDKLLNEHSDNELSFNQTILLENTQEKFNVRYKGASLHELEKFEEGIGTSLLAAASGGIYAMTGALPSIPLIAFGALTVIGLNLLLPARWTRIADNAIEKLLTTMGHALFGTKSMFAVGRLGASNNNIINFDNIDGNPEVVKLFNSLTRSKNKSAQIDGINTIVATCLDKNDVFENGDIDDSQKGFLRGKFSPRYNSIFSVLVESIFKKSANKRNEEFNTLLRYRKCLSEKLVDLYKFLMIANISQNKDYKKILRAMKKGFHDNPEQLLSFVNVDDEESKLNKENIMNLIKFRLFLTDMAKDLGRGAFDVDKEASTFLLQKLKTVDNEVEDYLSKNGRKIETVYENRAEFNRKAFKNKKPDEKHMKRHLMDLSGK